MKPRPFRFGVLGEGVGSAAALVDTARRAEAAGISFVMDQCLAVEHRHLEV